MYAQRPSTRAGLRAWPVYMQAASSGQSKKTLVLTEPEIDLGTSMRFHSVFACPVTRNASESGAPMMLSCGHVIGETTLASMRRRNECVACMVFLLARSSLG
jgi:hypothetical protein